MHRDIDPEDFNYDMADILNDEMEAKVRGAKVSERNSQNATQYNFTKEGFDQIAADIKSRGDKPTRERIADELEISQPTLRYWFKKLEYKIPK